MAVLVTGAPSQCWDDWQSIDWKVVRRHVYRLQMRIAKATREKDMGRAKALQHVLSRSFYAKLLAIKTVVSNKGSRTPGIDKVVWNTPRRRWNAIKEFKLRGYKAKPLRRIHIPKKNGKLRPLGIPTMRDRAMQALFALGLKPIAETQGDNHSYGFREKRSLHDAVEKTFVSLAHRHCAQWILEADIKGCFDNISHDWLMENIPIRKQMLAQWLKSGYMESGTLYETTAGTPQGGIISPILCTLTLDGLEELVIKGRSKKVRKLNVVRYADDFIITGATPEILLNELKPDVDRFLAERGLHLSEEKTRISHIDDGFEFLGFHFQKYKGKLITKPSPSKPKRLLENLREFFKAHHGIPFRVMLMKLNSILRGWAYAHRMVVAKKLMSFLDNEVFKKVCKWLRLAHREKNWSWISKRYRRRVKGRTDFGTYYIDAKGQKHWFSLFRMADLPIRYHVKILGEYNPYDPKYREYLEKRRQRQRNLAIRDRQFLSASSYEKIVAWK